MSAVRDDIDVYWGVASGSSHAALHNHYEGDPFYQDGPTPTHAMVSWRTAENQVWEGPTWMIDSGGAPQTIIKHGGHPDAVQDYIDWLERPNTRYGDDIDDVDLRYFAMRDWPCEPEVRRALNISTEELMDRTLVDHINTMNAYEDSNIDMEPMAVLQGFSVEEYLQSIDAYRAHGLLTDKIAIGTLCTRRNPQVVRTTGWRVARNLPSRCSIHGFGVKGPILEEPDALRIFGSIDTAAWNFSLRQATKDGVRQGPPGGEYDDWVDWSDRGNPRSTARNMWVAYRGYARRLADMTPVQTPNEMRVVTLDQLFQFSDEATPSGTRVDEYVIVQCPCGAFLDPGRPEPIMAGGPQCRHCERSELNIFDRRIMLEDEVRMGKRSIGDAQPFTTHRAFEEGA